MLLLHGWDPHRPGDPFWFTIGGGADYGETLPEAAARELAEETGIVVDPAILGAPVEASYTEFTWSGIHFMQDQTFFAVAVPAGATVSFEHQEMMERATTDKHGWLFPSDLEGSLELGRPADPDLPRVMRLAVAAVLGRG